MSELNLEKSLEKKVGPLPLGVWAVIGGGAIALIVVLRRRSAPATDTSGNGDGSTTVPNTNVPAGYIPTPVYADSNGGQSPGNTPSVPPSLNPPQNPPIQPKPPFGYNPPSKPTLGAGTPKAPSAPAPAQPTEPRGTSYPGLPPGYALNCNLSFRGLHGDYGTVLKTQQSKGQNDTFTKRNMMAIAIQGNTSPWIGRGDWNNKVSINNRRVANGLYPLTDAELDELFALIDTWTSQMGGNERNFLSHSEELFNRYSVPYQCTAGSGVRRSR